MTNKTGPDLKSGPVLFEKKEERKNKYLVCPAGRPSRPGRTVEFVEEGRGSLNLDAILLRNQGGKIKKLGTGSEFFVNTPR